MNRICLDSLLTFSSLSSSLWSDFTVPLPLFFLFASILSRRTLFFSLFFFAWVLFPVRNFLAACSASLKLSNLASWVRMAPAQGASSRPGPQPSPIFWPSCCPRIKLSPGPRARLTATDHPADGWSRQIILSNQKQKVATQILKQRRTQSLLQEPNTSAENGIRPRLLNHLAGSESLISHVTTFQLTQSNRGHLRKADCSN